MSILPSHSFIFTSKTSIKPHNSTSLRSKVTNPSQFSVHSSFSNFNVSKSTSKDDPNDKQVSFIDEWGEKSGPETRPVTKLSDSDPPIDIDEWGKAELGSNDSSGIEDEWGEKSGPELRPEKTVSDSDPPIDEDEWMGAKLRKLVKKKIDRVEIRDEKSDHQPDPAKVENPDPTRTRTRTSTVPLPSLVPKLGIRVDRGEKSEAEPKESDPQPVVSLPGSDSPEKDERVGAKSKKPSPTRIQTRFAAFPPLVSELGKLVVSTVDQVENGTELLGKITAGVVKDEAELVGKITAGIVEGAEVVGEITTGVVKDEVELVGKITADVVEGTKVVGKITTGVVKDEAELAGKIIAGVVEGAEVVEKVMTSVVKDEAELAGKITAGVIEDTEVVGKITTGVIEGAEIVGKITTSVIEGTEAVGKITTGVIKDEAELAGKITAGVVEDTEVVGKITTGVIEGAEVVGKITTGVIEGTEVVGKITTGVVKDEAELVGKITAGVVEGTMVAGEISAGVVKDEVELVGKITAGVVEDTELVGKIAAGVVKDEAELVGKITAGVVEDTKVVGKIIAGVVEDEIELAGKITTGVVEAETELLGKITSGVVENLRIVELKKRLIDTVNGTDFGLRTSSEVRAEVLELVAQLEAANPTPNPVDSPELLDGNWILVFTAFSELLPLLAVGTIPLLKVEKISQVISTSSLTIENSTTLSIPGATLSFNATAAFEVRSPSRIQVELKEGMLKPPEIKLKSSLPENLDIFGQNISLLPVHLSLNPLDYVVAAISRAISGLPPLKVPIPGERTKSWLITTYLDKHLRISRGDGGLFVLVKEESFLPDLHKALHL